MVTLKRRLIVVHGWRLPLLASDAPEPTLNVASRPMTTTTESIHPAPTAVAGATLDAVLTRLPHGLCLFDTDGHLLLANRAFRSLCGFADEAIEPGLTRDTLITLIEDAGLQEALLAAIEQPAGFAEARHFWRDGERLIAISCEPLPDGGCAILHEVISDPGVVAGRITQLANEDGLTGLLNRGAFHAAVARQMAGPAGGELALLYLDLDRFKAVNDTLGHLSGDRLLHEVAQRLRSMTRVGDLLGRLGGDEFALLQSNAAQPGASSYLATRIIDALGKPFCLDGATATIGVSVGVAIAPFDAETAEDLLKNADLALYQAKQDGRNLLRYFEPQMNEQHQARRSLEAKLRQAVKNDEFEVLYQPVMDLGSDQIVSAEALVRWRRPGVGLVPPDRFIPLAEETGLVSAIGESVLRQACRDAVSWNDHIRVAVNVSSVQLRDRAFVETVTHALAQTGLPAERLELEITESSLMADADLTIAILTALREEGVKIAMDDFGTGYSSIHYLRSFPFDKIKIDRSFVTGLDSDSESAALVKMIAALGVSLAVVTTAEGVETRQEMQAVRDAGCNQIQGYLLSEPVGRSGIAELLA